MAEKKTVALILVNYNGKNDTLACLESIGKLQTAGIDFSVIVVDNDSSDGSGVEIKQQYPQTKILALDRNYGFCRANNLGINQAYQNGSQYFLILNNDTVVAPDLISALVRESEREQADIASPKIYFSPGCEFHQDRYKKKDLGKVIWYAGGIVDWDNVIPSHRGVDEVDSGQYDRTETTDFATGCALFLSKKAYEAIGLFDERYFAYFEDADFSLRARRRGLKLIYASSAVIWHKNAASFGGSGSDFQDYFLTRNRFIFGWRYAPFRTKIALTRQGLSYLFHGPKLRRTAFLDALFRRISAVV